MQEAVKARKWSPLRVLLFALCATVFPVINAVWGYKFDWWLYDRKYAETLVLPHDLHPFYELPDYPRSVGGHNLTVRICKHDMTDDAEFRAWIADHNHATAFRPTMKSLGPPFGVWEASRGSDKLTFSRLDSFGWVAVCVVRG